MLSNQISKSIVQQVKEIIKNRLNDTNQEIHGQSNLEDLGIDSLDFVEIIMSLEDEFDIEIHDEDAEKLRTVWELRNYVRKRIG